MMNQRSLITTLLIVVSYVLIGQDSPWYDVDKSPLDAATYPTSAAYRNYMEGDERNLAPKIRVLYSRPKKNGRTIFGQLIPYGKEWRLGANEATTITFYTNVDIGNTFIPRGTYSMFAEIHEDRWIIRLSNELGLWGSYNRDSKKTIASIEVPVEQMNGVQEAFSITFKEVDPYTVHMVMQWDQTRVQVPIGFNPVVFSALDKSPMDMVTYPDKASGINYMKGDDKLIQPKVKILYSRPYKQGRKVFGELLKEGDVWRLGANESTEIEFYSDVMIKGTKVDKGKYVLYALLHESTWDLIFSKDFPAWGAYNRDESKDVYTIAVDTQKTNETVENLTIYFEEKSSMQANMIIGWDDTMIEIPIQF